MRAMVALVFLFVLISLGWNKSFETHWRFVMGKPMTEASKRALRNAPAYGSSPYGSGIAAEPAPTPTDRSWLFRRTILDPPNRR